MNCAELLLSGYSLAYSLVSPDQLAIRNRRHPLPKAGVSRASGPDATPIESPGQGFARKSKQKSM